MIAAHNYLVQHSAGSGKSNSIAWLAYRLSSTTGGALPSLLRIETQRRPRLPEFGKPDASRGKPSRDRPVACRMLFGAPAGYSIQRGIVPKGET